MKLVYIFLVIILIFPAPGYYVITAPDKEKRNVSCSYVDNYNEVISPSNQRNTTGLIIDGQEHKANDTISNGSMEQTTTMKKEAVERVHSHDEKIRAEKDTLFLNKSAKSPKSVNFAVHNLFNKRILRGNENETNTITCGEIENAKGRSSESPSCNKRSKRNVANTKLYDAILPHERRIRSKSKIFLPTLQNALLHPVNKSFQHNEKIKQEDEIDPQVKMNLLPIRNLNALRNALLIHPFETWSLKHKFASMKDIRIHEEKLQAVIKNPRNLRLKQKLFKVLQGMDVYLDVFGGSHTAGGGIEKDEGGIGGVYHRVITDWWGKTITPVTGSELKTRGIGITGTTSDFFQYCFRSYIHKQLDLVFLESAVNDMRKPVRIMPQEQLTRQLLSYPTEPALVYVNFFDGATCNNTCSNLEVVGQTILTDIYNITTLSWREAVCLKKAGSHLNPCDLVCTDGMHNNQIGHAHISLMVINLFRKILQESLSSLTKNVNVPVSRETNATRDLVSHAVPRTISRQHSQLPPPVFVDRGHLNTDPLCWTTVTPNFKKHVVNNSLDVVATKTEGFVRIDYTVSKSKKLSKKNCRLDGYSSWTGKTVGAYTELSFEVPALVSREGTNDRSVVIAIRSCWNCGTADVWVDNNYNEKRRIRLEDRLARTYVRIIAFRVKPGEHTLNTKVVKKGMVSLVALMLGPPDGAF